MEFQKKNFFYYTALHIACESESIDLVKYLISLNQIDLCSKTVLI